MNERTPIDDEGKRRQRQRSLFIGLALGLLSLLFYALTLSRFRGH
jgi:hypothetical protein